MTTRPGCVCVWVGVWVCGWGCVGLWLGYRRWGATPLGFFSFILLLC